MKRYDVAIQPHAAGLVSVEAPARVLADVAAHLGAVVPEGAHACLAGEATLFRSGPESLVLLTIGDKAPSLAASLADVAQDVSCIVADLSDAHGWIGLSGPDALAVLAQGVALDLRGSSFPLGHVARTLCFGVEIILHRVEQDAFRIGCRASHVDFMEARLKLAAAPMEAALA